MYQPGQQRRHQNGQHKIIIQRPQYHGQRFGVFDRLGHFADQAERHEHQRQPQENVGGVFELPPLPVIKFLADHADDDQGGDQGSDIKAQQLGHQSGADIRAQDDGDGGRQFYHFLFGKRDQQQGRGR